MTNIQLGRLLPSTLPCPLQEAVDDIFSALKLDSHAAVPEIRSLKPEAQALITQGLSSRCRALLSQLPDAGAPLSDGDFQGLLAAGEALIQIDARQLSWHVLLADVLLAMGMPERGQRGVRPSSSHPWSLFCKTRE